MLSHDTGLALNENNCQHTNKKGGQDNENTWTRLDYKNGESVGIAMIQTSRECLKIKLTGQRNCRKAWSKDVKSQSPKRVQN